VYFRAFRTSYRLSTSLLDSQAPFLIVVKVVLNTLESTTALLEKRGSIYSHRPILVMLGQLMGLNRVGINFLVFGKYSLIFSSCLQSMALFNNDDKFRKHRKLTHTALGSGTIDKYHHIQERITLQLICALLQHPADFVDLFRLSAGGIIMAVAYGIEVDSPDNAVSHVTSIYIVSKADALHSPYYQYITDAECVLKIISASMAPNAVLLDHSPLCEAKST
jgi:hypothetical protein